ncbi:MAG: hypothetical protein II750_08865 [Bacteroidaceae bacterium]|nr:hypothetical protein [Bacteroidaceae bacterium]
MRKTWGRRGEDVEKDMGKIWGRYGEDVGKMWGKDMGKMQGKLRKGKSLNPLLMRI